MSINNEMRARHAQCDAKNQALEQQQQNYNRKVDNQRDKENKAVDNTRANLHTKGKNFAQAVDSLFDDAKINAQRPDYNNMSTTDVLLDIGKRGVSNAWDGIVDYRRDQAKAAYDNVVKPAAKAVTGFAATVQKEKNELKADIKKGIKDIATSTRQTINRAETIYDNIKAGIKHIERFTSAMFGL